ncbi:hypothetical protein BASA60_003271 [Batrachochytrium salamandrivorans]|nr:hypothetical protein BASA60_003271 [Batrachochytrium salamandrivorans]
MVQLEVNNLTKKLPNGALLFDSICFQANDSAGPFVLAVRGPSGSGKTTLLKCLAELTPYDSGTIHLNTKGSGDYGVPEWRSRVIYVPQRPPVLDGTPRDFVDTISKFQAQKRRAPNGILDPVLIAQGWNLEAEAWDKPWNQLSGGEIQRVAIALGISRNPDILLLDEPTSALDPETCRLVENTLTKHNCIWITHDPAQEERVATDSIFLASSNISSASLALQVQ